MHVMVVPGSNGSSSGSSYGSSSSSSGGGGIVIEVSSTTDSWKQAPLPLVERTKTLEYLATLTKSPGHFSLRILSDFTKEKCFNLHAA